MLLAPALLVTVLVVAFGFVVAPSDEISALCVAVMNSLHDLRHAAFA